MKLKIYLDTSIFSAYFDDRAPDRRAQTEEFWERIAAFEACSSELAREELAKTPDADRRKRLLRLLDGMTVHRIAADMKQLSEQYVRAGVFTPITMNMPCMSLRRFLPARTYCCPGISSIS